MVEVAPVVQRKRRRSRPKADQRDQEGQTSAANQEKQRDRQRDRADHEENAGRVFDDAAAQGFGATSGRIRAV